jgi:hypothetical protein
MQLTTRILVTNAELETFSNSFRAVGGNEVSVAYLSQSKPRGFFRGDELVAGFVLNSRAPFRYASWIPASERERFTSKGFFVAGTSAELTCIWMAKKKLSKIERNNVYVYSTIDAWKARKRLIFGGSTIPTVAKIQKRALPTPLYTGMASFGGNCEIYYATRLQMAWSICRAATITYTEDILRLLGSRLRNFRSATWSLVRGGSCVD